MFEMSNNRLTEYVGRRRLDYTHFKSEMEMC